MKLHVGTSTSSESHNGTHSTSIRRRTGQLHVKIIDTPLCGEIAHQHHRRSIDLVRDNIQISIVIEIDNDRRSRSTSGPNGDILWSAGEGGKAILSAELKPRQRQATLARFDA